MAQLPEYIDGVPNISGEEDLIARVIEETALDLGDPDWDSTYGWGLIDVEAVLRREAQNLLGVVLHPVGEVLVGRLHDQGTELDDVLVAEHCIAASITRWSGQISHSGQTASSDTSAGTAVAAALLADVRPGDRVLDLCAAPGGKATAA